MKVLRVAEVIEKTGLARSTVYKYVDLGMFPRPISLGGKSVGWIDSEIHEWLQEKQIERDMRYGASDIFSICHKRTAVDLGGAPSRRRQTGGPIGS